MNNSSFKYSDVWSIIIEFEACLDTSNYLLQPLSGLTEKTPWTSPTYVILAVYDSIFEMIFLTITEAQVSCELTPNEHLYTDLSSIILNLNAWQFSFLEKLLLADQFLWIEANDE